MVYCHLLLFFPCLLKIYNSRQKRERRGDRQTERESKKERQVGENGSYKLLSVVSDGLRRKQGYMSPVLQSDLISHRAAEMVLLSVDANAFSTVSCDL